MFKAFKSFDRFACSLGFASLITVVGRVRDSCSQKIMGKKPFYWIGWFDKIFRHFVPQNDTRKLGLAIDTAWLGH